MRYIYRYPMRFLASKNCIQRWAALFLFLTYDDKKLPMSGLSFLRWSSGLIAFIAAPLATATTIVLAFPAFSGQVIEGGFPISAIVGQQELKIPAGETIVSATVSGTWGNPEWPQGTAGTDVMLEGVLVARCLKPDPNCWGPTAGAVPWTRQLAMNERALLKPGIVTLTAVQTSDTRVRLGDTTLTITTRPGRIEKAAQFEGMWNSTLASELGWGINFAQQDDLIFATWFTYDASGRASWLAASLQQLAPDGPFEGTVYSTNGPPFNSKFSAAAVVATMSGTMRVTFSSPDKAVLDYSVNGISRTQPIQRQVFGTVPTCTWSTQADLNAARNFQDLWWSSPAQSEAGWGVNFTHQGDTIYATWFTYDELGRPWWLAAVMQQQIGVGVTYGGNVLAFDGPPFGSKFNAAQVHSRQVGSATVWFGDGNRAVFTSTVNGFSQGKTIERQIWGPAGSGTICK